MKSAMKVSVKAVFVSNRQGWGKKYLYICTFRYFLILFESIFPTLQIGIHICTYKTFGKVCSDGHWVVSWFCCVLQGLNISQKASGPCMKFVASSIMGSLLGAFHSCMDGWVASHSHTLNP